MKRIYLDHAAATPVDLQVAKVVLETMKKFPANPSALHKEGVLARAVLEGARADVARVLFARPDEIVFTSGATEANNTAIMGVVLRARAQGVEHPHIIVSAIEHPSVLEVTRTLERNGVAVSYLSVDGCGVIDLKALRKLIMPNTVLVSVMYANNEVGTIEPLTLIAKEVRHARKVHGAMYPYLHTDAVQAVNYLDINVLRLGIDLMTISSGKAYGPRGIGALFVKRGVAMEPLMYGGEHEAQRRPGTESPALARGFAEALLLAEKMKMKECARLGKLRDLLEREVRKKIPGTAVNGDLSHSLPNILNISFDGMEGEALVLYLDGRGVAVSGKSACKSSRAGTSHVILAMGKAGDREAGAVRFSLGRATTREDIVQAVRELVRIVELLRTVGKQSDL